MTTALERLPLRACLTAAAGMGLGLAGQQAWAVPQIFTVVDAGGQAVPDAVVSIMVKGAKATTTTGTADMSQRDKQFSPTVLAIQTGTSVSFPNFDTVRHHVYSFSPTKTFELRLYAGTPAAPVVFDKPGTATLGCNIHDKMLAYIHVVSTPYFGRTDAGGNLSIDVPPGEHLVRIWSPRMGDTLAPTETTVKTGNLVVLKIKG